MCCYSPVATLDLLAVISGESIPQKNSTLNAIQVHQTAAPLTLVAIYGILLETVIQDDLLH